MGVIKDGTITGTIPERRLFAVNYPGYASSISRAMETLGGEEGLLKARASENGFLDLRFRPEDPFCHPAFGELHSSRTLLLRISKGSMSSSTSLEKASAETNGLEGSKGSTEFGNNEIGNTWYSKESSIKETGNAEVSKSAGDLSNNEAGCAELTSGESRKETKSSELSDRVTERVGCNAELRDKVTENGEPPIKETENGCRNGELGDKATGSEPCSSKETGIGRHSAELSADIVARIEQTYDFIGMADYQYVVPVHADHLRNKRRKLLDQTYEQRGVMEMEEEEMMLLVPPLFSLKDMPDNVVMRSTELSRAPQKLADQPWETSIVRCFNLDFNIKEVPPKINWEEKLAKGSADWHLQAAVSKLFDERPIWAKPTLNDLLVEQGIQLSDFNLRRVLFRTSYYFSQGPFRTMWIRNGYDPRKDPESRIFQMIDFRIPFPLKETADAYVKEQQCQRNKETWKDICSFKAIASKKFLFLQLFDLEDAYIQEQIRKPAERTTCSKYTGWFHRSTIERLRLQLRIRFISLIPGQLARSLEQIESRKLQRLKRLEGACDAEADIEADKELEDDERQLNEEVNDEEDNEEEEEENYLQEEGFSSVPRSMETYLDPSDSVPQNYLQELVGKFSFSATDGMTTLDSSGDFNLFDEDAEYAIFDQDIDYDSDE